MKLVKHFTPHTSEKGWKIHLSQYLISSSETTCWLSPIDPNCGGGSSKDVGIQRHNMILVTQLFLSLKSRPDANMADFFRFENQREPPSLADRGSLRAGKKSDILQCLGATTGRVYAAQQATVVVLDMAAIIHMVRPTRANTFSEYVTFQIVPFLESEVTNDTQRMDAVWDSYPPEDNLKLNFSQYQSIHTNYIISHCTTLRYNHNIWHGT